MSTAFRALMLHRGQDRNDASIVDLHDADLPAGDVLVRVHYSNIGYKDGLAVVGNGQRQVVQCFPMIAGVDFSGVVEHSDSPRFKAGDQVILNGWGVGEKHWGGFADKARVSADWLVPLPAGMTLKQAMEHGSAGLSAMLCIHALERYGIDKAREVLVTGASGGVGSVALLLLARLGYRPVAVTGRDDHTDYLKALGATRFVARDVLAQAPATPLLDEEWGGAIDTVGGSMLAHVLASMAYGGAIASLGLVGGRDLNTTVMPFIQRAVALLGINSVYCPNTQRSAAWERLAALLPDGLPGNVVDVITLEQVQGRAAAIVRGEVRGRTIVALAGAGA